MAREKVAVTVELTATPVAFEPGELVMVGGEGAVAAVVNVHMTGPASCVPSDCAVIPVVTVAV
jgi:hypothetical protein